MQPWPMPHVHVHTESGGDSTCHAVQLPAGELGMDAARRGRWRPTATYCTYTRARCWCRREPPARKRQTHARTHGDGSRDYRVPVTVGLSHAMYCDL